MKTHRLFQAGLLFALGILSCQAAPLQVSTNQANLRAGASLEKPVVEVARQGEPLEPLALENGYVQVRRGNGRTGWIHAAGQGWTEAEVRAAMAAPAPARPQAPSAPRPEPAVPAAAEATAEAHPLSLATLGLKQGHFFEGARGVHSQVFFFPLPADGSARSGVVRLHYRTSGRINPMSTLRVDVNDKPVRTLSLEGREESAWLEVPVSAGDLAKTALKVTVRASLVATRDRCFDERSLALYFVHLMPDSRLDLDLPAGDGSLRAAFSRLPAKVRIGLPAQLDESVYATALETAILLRRARHQVELVTLPARGDIVVAPDAEVQALFGASGATPAEDQKAWGEARVARYPDGAAAIVLGERLDPRLLGRDAPVWLGLLAADRYLAQLPGPDRNPVKPERLDLLALGLEPVQYVNRTVEWSMLLTPPAAPAGAWLDSLRLNLVAPPESAAGKMLLYVYLNGALQEVRALEQDGKPHVESFSLGRGSQRAGANHLRLVVQRVAAEGDCSGDAATFPVQFLPGSLLTLDDWDQDPVRFNDLRALFSDGPELWVTAASRADLHREASLLTGLYANHGFPFRRDRLHFLNGDAKPAPTGPFILMGRTGQEPDRVSVHLNRGRVQVLDAENRSLLALDHLPQISVAQLVGQGGQHGLWLAPAADGPLPPADELFLDQDDVAFLDQRGIVLTLDSRQHALARASYPDYLDWLDLAERYRFWIIGLGWTLLVVFLLHLYRKSRKHAGR